MSLDRTLRCAVVLVAALLSVRPSAAQPIVPGSDTCATATVMPPATSFGHTVDTRNAGPDSVPGCGGPALIEQQRGVWYTITPTADVVMQFENRPWIYHYDIRLFTETCGQLTPIACAVDLGTFALFAGTQYFILTGPTTPVAPTSSPYYSIRVSFGPPIVNDTCANARSILATSANFSEQVPVRYATPDLDNSCNAPTETSLRNGIWYTYIPAANTTVRFADLNANDTVVAVYTGSCGALVPVGCYRPHAVIEVTAGVQYFFLMGLYARVTDSYWGTPYDDVRLSVTASRGTSPVNDDCGDASPLTLGVVQTVPSAFLEPDANPGCSSVTVSEIVDGAVWFSFVPEQDGWYRFETGAENVAFYTGACDALVPVQCFGRADNLIHLSSGVRYLCLIGRNSDRHGTPPTYVVRVTRAVIPTNVDCASAIALSGTPQQLVVDTRLMNNAVTTACGTQSGYGVWYTFSFPVATRVLFDADYFPYYNVLTQTLYAGQCGSLTEVFCATSWESIHFLAQPGQTYWLRIGARNTILPQRPFDFTLRFATVPPNDTCETATEVSQFPFYRTVNALGAGLDGPGALCGFPSYNSTARYGVWYRVIVPSEGFLSVEAASDAAVARFESTTCTSEEPSFCDSTPDSTNFFRVPVRAGINYIRISSESTYALPTGYGYQGHFEFIPSACGAVDFDHSGAVDTTDIILYLDAWFRDQQFWTPGLPADFNRSERVNAQDLFDYLAEWFVYNGSDC